MNSRYRDRKRHFVYLIGAEGLQENKIGRCSTHPRNRMRELNTGSPRELLLVTWCEVRSPKYAKSLEKHLHEAFSRKRLRVEWFNYIHHDEFHHQANQWSGGEILARGENGRENNLQARTFARALGDARITDFLPSLNASDEIPDEVA